MVFFLCALHRCKSVIHYIWLSGDMLTPFLCTWWCSPNNAAITGSYTVMLTFATLSPRRVYFAGRLRETRPLCLILCSSRSYGENYSAALQRVTEPLSSNSFARQTCCDRSCDADVTRVSFWGHFCNSSDKCVMAAKTVVVAWKLFPKVE